MLCLGPVLRKVQILSLQNICLVQTHAQRFCLYKSGQWTAADSLVALLYPLDWGLIKCGLVRPGGQLSPPSPPPPVASSRGPAIPLWQPLLSLSSSITQIHLIHPLSLNLNVTPAGESLLMHRNMQSATSVIFLVFRLVHLNPPLIKLSLACVICVPFRTFLNIIFIFILAWPYLSLSPLCNTVPASRAGGYHKYLLIGGFTDK